MSRRSTGVDSVLEAKVPGRDFEDDIQIRLYAPGQRGILQTLMEVKNSATKLIPKYKAMQTANRVALKRQKPIASQTRRLEKHLRKARRYLDNFQLATDDAKKAQLLVALSQALMIAMKAQQQLKNGAEQTTTLANDLKASIRQTNGVLREFQQELKRDEAVAESWLDVKWTKDNATAVGRGPPGHIAYNPLVQYSLPYEVGDVKRVIDEASKRVR